MTPELMAAGARIKAIHEGRPVPTSTESGGRETSYGRIATGASGGTSAMGRFW